MEKPIKKAASALADFMPVNISGTQLEFFSKTNVTSSQLITLMSVFVLGRCSMGQLAKHLHVTMPTATGLIDRLIKLNLVKRSVSEKDRRKVYIELSPKGEALIKDLKALVRHRWEKLFAILNPVEIKHFQKIIEKINRYLQRRIVKDEK